MSNQPARASFGDLYARVADMLADGRYRPGDRVGVKELSEQLHVSVTPVREILSRLVGRDIVEERRSDGYFLPRIDARDIADLYRLHLACMELAIRHAGPWDFGSHDDANAWSLFDRIIQAQGDRILASVQRYLADRLRILRRCERQLDLLGENDHFVEILSGAKTTQELRALVRDFHRRRLRSVQEISIALSRG